MKRWSALNGRQLSVLKRVGDGDDLSGSEGLADRQSAYALSSRGLIVVRKRGGTFRAQATEAGRFCLAEGRHPDQPDRSTTSRSSPTTAPRQRAAHPKAGTIASRTAKAAELMERLVAEHKMILARPTAEEIVASRRMVDFAKRHGLVPEGHRIKSFTTWEKDLEIRLVASVYPNVRQSASLA